MIDLTKVAFYIPAELQRFKRELFLRVGKKICKSGGRVVEARAVEDVSGLEALSNDMIPVIGAAPYLFPLVRKWRSVNRQWIGWDRGYARRVFATWLPRGENGGYYRWTVNAYQMRSIRSVPSDRWNALGIEVAPWKREGRHIVLAMPSPVYALSHDDANGWTEKTMKRLIHLTNRQIVIRDKESKRPLQNDLAGAHCLVAHGSIAAVEAVILGCPVFVHSDSAAALVGSTNLDDIEHPVYPDRTPWLASLAYSQFNEAELVDGTLWRLLQ